jgi:hypothetical protein
MVDVIKRNTGPPSTTQPQMLAFVMVGEGFDTSRMNVPLDAASASVVCVKASTPRFVSVA